MDFKLLIPEIIVLITAAFILFGEWMIKMADREKKNSIIGLITVNGLLAALGVLIGFRVTGYSLISYFGNTQAASFFGSFISDDLALYFKIIILISSILALLISFKYVSEKIKNVSEFYSLVCMATLGAMFVSSAGEMITLFLGIELLSISSYILAGFNKENKKSAEASLKYFVIGSTSSILLLYGFSIIFGLTGSLNFATIASSLDKQVEPMSYILIIGAVCALAGLAYKIVAVPFHMWAPDVYEGAPTPITAFLAITSKIAGFAALTRFIVIFTDNSAHKILILVIALSVITMTFGNFVSLAQTNMKRLFAYSSITHAGYLLMGLIPLIKNKPDDYGSLLFYLTAYIFMNIGAFAAIIYFSKHTGSTEIKDFSGVAKKAPFVAFVFAACLVSLAGLPPFAGFTGKFYLFFAVVNSGYTWLALFGALNSVISLYYYVRIIKLMYFGETPENIKFEIPNPALATAIFISLVGILALFIFPNTFIELARTSLLGL